MLHAPMGPAQCLGDVFASQGYANHFLHSSDNHFENQGTFYQHHKMKTHGKENFHTGAAKGGWGYSDWELYKYSLRALAAEKGPFFATILNLTNHGPFVVPSDAPRDIQDSPDPLQERVIRYVDWSIAQFFREIEKRLPHTLFVLVADHGVARDGDSQSRDVNYEELRKVARIPLVFLVPNLPPSLRGQSYRHLTSIIDVAPTISALLGLAPFDNQFMGMNAFTRSGPVYINWYGSVKEITSPADGDLVRLRELGDHERAVLRSLTRFNRLFPGGG